MPDYVQIRNEDFMLTAFVNLSGLERGLKKNKLEKYKDVIEEKLANADFNEVVYIKEG